MTLTNPVADVSTNVLTIPIKVIPVDLSGNAGLPASSNAIGSVINSPVDGQRATYSASVTALAVASSATDIFTITGSATKTVRVTRIRVSGIKTSAGADVDVQLIVRSAANTSGTSTSPTIIPFDSNNAAATAVVKAYTANPTTGAAVGTIAVDSVFIPLATAAGGLLDYNFGNRPGQAVVLRGTAQVLAVNLNGVTVGGGALDIWCEFTEE